MGNTSFFLPHPQLGNPAVTTNAARRNSHHPELPFRRYELSFIIWPSLVPRLPHVLLLVPAAVLLKILGGINELVNGGYSGTEVAVPSGQSRPGGAIP